MENDAYSYFRECKMPDMYSRMCLFILVMLDQTAKKILSNSIKKPVHKDLSLFMEISSWV